MFEFIIIVIFLAAGAVLFTQPPMRSVYVLIAAGATTFYYMFVVPKLILILSDFDVKMPYLVLKTIDVSTVMINYWQYMVCSAGILVCMQLLFNYFKRVTVFRVCLGIIDYGLAILCFGLGAMSSSLILPVFQIFDKLGK